MATFYEVPLISLPETFSMSLAGVVYTLTVKWYEAGGQGWVLDIADQDGNPMLAGRPLVTGCDLLEQYAYLGIGGSLYVTTDGDPDAVPTFTNLGTTAHLFFATQP